MNSHEAGKESKPSDVNLNDKISFLISNGNRSADKDLYNICSLEIAISFQVRFFQYSLIILLYGQYNDFMSILAEMKSENAL